MQKVLIDLEKIRYPLNGIGQYCTRFGEVLGRTDRAMNEQFESYLLVPPNKKNIFGSKIKYWAENKLLRVMPFLQKKFDLWHSTHQSPRHTPFSSKTKYVLSIMDLNFVDEVADKNFVKEELARIQKLVDRADYITVISHYVENHIRKHLEIKDTPIEVVYMSHALNLELTPRPFEVKKAFLFSIGVVDPKKNFHVLLPLLKELPDFELVVAGPNNTDYAKVILNQAKELGIEDRFHFAGAIDDEQKLWLYQNCSAFVFPSLLEGFGIPPIEAMRVGKPVFISDRCSLPEVTGGKAYVWKSFDVDHMKDVFSKGMQDYSSHPNRAKELVDFAKGYSWQKTTNQYLDIYKRVLAQ